MENPSAEISGKNNLRIRWINQEPKVVLKTVEESRKRNPGYLEILFWDVTMQISKLISFNIWNYYLFINNIINLIKKIKFLSEINHFNLLQASSFTNLLLYLSSTNFSVVSLSVGEEENRT